MDEATAASTGRGLVAIGDSITRGSGDSMLGLRMQSWALWLAEALSLPYTGLARDGARAPDALAAQVPRMRGPYELGCVYLGLNDVRTPGFELEPYVAAMASLLDAMGSQCERLLVLGLPRTVGLPPAPPWAIAGAQEALRRLAAERGATLAGLEALAGRELVQPDAVHLTARGQATIALLALRALEREGVRGDAGELQRALEPLRPAARLRWLTVGRAPAVARDLRRRVVEGAGRPRGGRR